MKGGFKDGVGPCLAEDMQVGRKVIVRFEWSKITPRSAVWEQAFSPDGGKTWEMNWHMDFVRTRDAHAACAYDVRMNDAPVPGRQRLNVTLSGELVDEAKALGLNLSRACERGLEAAVADERARRWQAENAAFFDWYNAKVETDGLLLAEHRQF